MKKQKPRNHYAKRSEFIGRRLRPIALSLCMLTFAGVSAQTGTVSVKVHNGTVKELFKSIEKQTSYRFSYREAEVSSLQSININAQNKELKGVLTEELSKLGLTYQVQGRKIIITSAQQRVSAGVVTGQVVDSKGETVIGATVMEKGTTNGTITDFDGKFTLNVSDNAILEISFVGFKTQQMRPIPGKSLNIILKEDTEVLDEVVVVGYGIQKKVNLTGAVGVANMDEVLKNRPVSDVGSALKGAIPGLQITSSNALPGSNQSFNVRGFTSINGGGPLILVDNVPMDINMLDPNDIESISVLKDAASAAIYGAKSAFGVILVTTKKGKKDEKLKVSYSNNFSFSSAVNLPEKASPLEEVNTYKATGQSHSSFLGCDLEKWLGYLNDYQQNPSKYPDGKVYDEFGQLYPLAEHNLIDDMMDNFGFQHKHNFSVQGSGTKNTYRLSLGIVNEDGILYSDKDNYKRYNVSGFWKVAAAKWMDVEADIKYSNSDRSYVPETGIRGGLYGNAVQRPSYFILQPAESYPDGFNYPMETPKSCIIYSDPVHQDNKMLRMLGRVTLKPFKGMNIVGEYSYLYDNSDKNAYYNRFIYRELNEHTRENRANSSVEKNKNSSETNTINIFGTYNKAFDDHNFTIMGGFNQESKRYEQLQATKQDVIASELPSISLSTGELKASDSYWEYATRSLFYRLNYDYKGKYLFETNGRYDGSSKFPKGNRFGFFPSVSLAWRISEEPFMKKTSEWMDNLKLRASIGTVGNQSIGNYMFIPGMSGYLSTWLVDGKQLTTVKSPNLVSSDFTWETVVTYNVGLDVSLFKRLSASFDYYIRDTKDMLTAGMELPSVLGTNAPKENVADLRTKGWELGVKWHDSINDFNYNIGFNLYDSKSEITRFDNEVGLLSSKYVGMQIGEIWGYETDRLYQPEDFDENGKLLPGIPKVLGVNPNPGDILYKDQNGDGIIDEGKNTLSDSGDQVIIGNEKRRFQYAINGGFDWKGFDFSFIINGVGKRDLWMNNEMVFPLFTEFSSVQKHQLDYWTPNNLNAYHSRLYEQAKGNTSANRKKQTRYLLDGSYWKIQNISLGYTIPTKWTTKFGISRLNVYLSGENLFTSYKTPKGINPESANNQSGWYYPEMRKLSFGLNLTL